MQRILLLLGMTLGLLLAAPLADAHAQSQQAYENANGNASFKRGTTSAPELDASSAGSALVLVLGGAAFLLARRRRSDERSS